LWRCKALEDEVKGRDEEVEEEEERDRVVKRAKKKDEMNCSLFPASGFFSPPPLVINYPLSL
jgi:hypothetical protein